MPGAEVIAIKRRRIIRAFREAGATSPGSAKTLDEIGLHHSLLVHVQKLRRVLIEVEAGRFYLDESRYRSVQRMRFLAIAAWLVVIAALILVFRAR